MQALTKLLPPAPTDAELAQLKAAAEAARTAAAQAVARVQAIEAEIATTQAKTLPRPDLAREIAALKAQEIEANVKGIPLPKDHAKRIAETRAAAGNGEVERLEAETLLPVLEGMRADMKAEADRLDNEASRAGSAYGSALAAVAIGKEYAPRLAALLEAERAIREIETEWGSRWYVETAFRAPDGGDTWTSRELDLVEAAAPATAEG
jgi:hypothetical protein